MALGNSNRFVTIGRFEDSIATLPQCRPSKA
jgi:hypothetical protein